MPDWSYHTLFAPILFRLPAAKAKQLTLNAVSLLGSIPGGSALIDFMGHMRPSSGIIHETFGVSFSSLVGLGAGLSINRGTVKAFERFGFGFIELGPITLNHGLPEQELQLDLPQEAIICKDLLSSEGLENFLKKHLPTKQPEVPIFIRLAHPADTSSDIAGDEFNAIHERLPHWIAALVIETRSCLEDWKEPDLDEYLRRANSVGRRIILAICPDTSDEVSDRLLRSASASRLTGVYITGGMKDKTPNKRKFGKPTHGTSLQLVKKARKQLAEHFIIGGGGVIEPVDALSMLEAGADLVSLHSGLIYSGPGLSKRINELITYKMSTQNESRSQQALPLYSIPGVVNNGWLGLALVGLGLIVTGASAITVALTTVVLPYDEIFLGLTRTAMLQMNNNLLPFLSHDRVTYAGAAMSCGLLFAWLSCFGARCGQHWAYIAARTSCAFGFISFFLFLGFHYLDPLHALVTLILLPFFVWALLKQPVWQAMWSSNMHNSQSWRASLQGQFWFVSIGIGLILAGITICGVGITTVFVTEDLGFMHTTANALLCHSEHLLPAIAHDRAGFGGTLVTSGIAVLLTSLHGFRQGEGWVWWMLLSSGLPGFLATLGIHYAIGYTNWFHLLPAYIATVMFAAGLSLSYRYLCIDAGPSSTTL